MTGSLAVLGTTRTRSRGELGLNFSARSRGVGVSELDVGKSERVHVYEPSRFIAWVRLSVVPKGREPLARRFNAGLRHPNRDPPCKGDRTEIPQCVISLNPPAA